MATKIVTKNSSTAGSAPLASDLVQGELAVNVTDKRLYTENASGTVVEVGTNPSAEIIANGGIALPDNGKATFGASDDLQIYHDGSNSYIQDAGTGSLNIKSNGSFIDIQSDSTRINNAANNEIMATFVANGAVTAYYDNAAKLTTTATGIDVTGTATMDGLTVDGVAQLGTVSIYDNGTNATVVADVGHDLELRGRAGQNVNVYANGALNTVFSSTGIDVTGSINTTGGIYLGGTAAANLLDDYEEGTWTPTLEGDTSGSAPLTVTGSTYTKIGNTVHAYCYLTAIDLSADDIVGNMVIKGLPFNVATNNLQSVSVTYQAISSTYLNMSGRITSGFIRLQQDSTNFSLARTDCVTTSGKVIMVGCIYPTNA